ncbi:MAG: S8 family serine peptidase [Ilumatobacteraceae bacterium]
MATSNAASGSNGKSRSGGKSDDAGKSESAGSPGKSDVAGKSDNPSKSDSAGASGKSDNPGKSDDAPSEKSKGSNDGSSKDGNAKGDDAENDAADDESDESQDDTPQTFIVRFAAGVRADEAGKALIDDYNEDVKKFNSAARAEAARSAAQAKAEAARAAAAARKAGRASPKAATKFSAKTKKRGSFDFSFKKVLNAAVIQVPESAVSGLLRNPKVLSIEQDASVSADPTPVSQVGAPWGLDRIDQRTLPLSNSFSSPGNGAGVSVYVVDTGIDATHPEFGGRVASGFDAIDGGDGRTDCNSHGTHVAGTVGSTTYGVAKGATLVPIRVLGCDGSGTYAGVIAGLDWLAQNRAAGEKAIANMSLGGGGSSSLDSAVASLVAAGVAVVVAAGNSNTDACTTSPARAASAITVAATTTTDSRASYSNYGSCVDVFAPGSNVISTVPGGGTATYSGTSMAAPHVAGAAAVMLSLRDYTPSALSSYLLEVATTGVVSSVGNGSPNLLAFLPSASQTPSPSDPEPVATVPDQPDAPIAESRNKAAVVSWSIPSDGGAAITTQIVRAYLGSRVVSTVSVDGTTSSVRVPRLRNGVEYTFTVQARNSVGAGRESAPSAPVRPAR